MWELCTDALFISLKGDDLCLPHMLQDGASIQIVRQVPKYIRVFFKIFDAF
jgi:hypothetical protein